jgi:hypothetical protein
MANKEQLTATKCKEFSYLIIVDELWFNIFFFSILSILHPADLPWIGISSYI